VEPSTPPWEERSRGLSHAAVLGRGASAGSLTGHAWLRCRRECSRAVGRLKRRPLMLPARSPPSQTPKYLQIPLNTRKTPIGRAWHSLAHGGHSGTGHVCLASLCDRFHTPPSPPLPPPGPWPAFSCAPTTRAADLRAQVASHSGPRHEPALVRERQASTARCPPPAGATPTGATPGHGLTSAFPSWPHYPLPARWPPLQRSLA
jgi:hypothetical protein